MTLLDTYSPKLYRIRRMAIEKTDVGIDAYIVLEILTNGRRGVDAVRVPVSFTPAERQALRQKVLNTVDAFALAEGLTEAPADTGVFGG